jgi:hypothetical protein
MKTQEILAQHQQNWQNITDGIDGTGTRLDNVQSRTRATYPYRRPKFALANGILGEVVFHVNEDWNYYSKRYNKPKVTVTGKGVEFTFPKAVLAGTSCAVNLKKVFQPVERFAGNWLLEVLARQFGKTKINKDLRKVQLHECFSLLKIRSIASVEIYARIVAGTVYDYCALAGKETYHASSPKLAIAGLREKRTTRNQLDAELLTFRGAKKAYHFCDTGLRIFCADNDIDVKSALTRAELRNIVINKKELNCGKYSADLYKIGIKLNCK